MRTWEKRAIYFLLKHLAGGAAGAVAAATAILLFDVANIGSMASSSEYGVVAVVMLYGSLILTFGSVAMGVGVMTLNEDKRP